MSDYHNAHNRVRRAWGPASLHSCLWCGCTALDWAYDWSDPGVMRDERNGLSYSDDPHRYMPLCRPCHRTLDAAHTRDSAGVRAAIPRMERRAWDRATDTKRELDAKRRADQIRLFLKFHYPQAVAGQIQPPH